MKELTNEIKVIVEDIINKENQAEGYNSRMEDKVKTVFQTYIKENNENDQNLKNLTLSSENEATKPQN